jgi:hypothetical protein
MAAAWSQMSASTGGMLSHESTAHTQLQGKKINHHFSVVAFARFCSRSFNKDMSLRKE